MSSYRIDMEVHTSKTGDAYKETATDIDNLSKKTKQASADIDAHTKSTDKLTSSKKNLGTSLSNATSKLDLFGSGLGGATSKVGAATGSIGGLAASIGGKGGLIGIVVAAGIAFAAFAAASYQAAQSSQAEWAKFRGIAEDAGKSFEEQKSVVKEFAFEAGLAVADVRTAQQKLIQTNNASPGALAAVHEMSIGLGSNMETAATAYARIIAGSGQYKRTLIQLGINPEDIMDKTTGKVNAEKLQKVLEEKYGTAADNYAKTSQAAQQRLTNAGQAAMVAFGGVLQGAGIGLMNGLATIIKGVTDFFQQVYVNVAPVFGKLGEAFAKVGAAFMSIFPEGTGGNAFKTAVAAVSWILGAFANTLIFILPYVITLGQYLYIAGQYLWQFGMAVYNFYVWWYNLPGQIYAGIMNGINQFVSGAISVGRWLWNLPGSLWSLLVSKIPTLRWPTAGEILGAIKGALGISGPGYSMSSLTSQYNYYKTQSEASKANALRATLTSTSPSVAPSTPNYGSLLNRFSGPGDVNPNYVRYTGHKTNDVWNGDCLTGNCVDMTMGMMGRYGGSFALGSWNGGGHMWYVAPNGQQLDPSRKALEGTWNPPAQGPGSGSTIVIPVAIGGNKVAEFIVDTVTKNVYSAGRF